MKLLFFGSLGERIARSIELELPAAVKDIGGLRRHLSQTYPQCADDLRSDRVRACIGDSIVDELQPVSDSSEVEFFPPLSGG